MPGDGEFFVAIDEGPNLKNQGISKLDQSLRGLSVSPFFKTITKERPKETSDDDPIFTLVGQGEFVAVTKIPDRTASHPPGGRP